MNRGYVKLYRKSLDAGWIRNHKLWALWTYCLLKATHREFDAIIGLQSVHLMPGQFIFGRKKASSETGLTEREIRTLLAFLIKSKNLTSKTTNKFSLITIVNWDIYQSNDIENDQQNDQQVTSRRPHTRIKTHKNKILYTKNALEVLTYLNEKTGREYKISKHIEARLKEGASIEDCKKVIDAKIIDSYFIQNPKYLNPDTLFRPDNFDKYKNEIIPLKTKNPKSNVNSACPRCGAQVPPQDRTISGCIICENQNTEVTA